MQTGKQILLSSTISLFTAVAAISGNASGNADDTTGGVLVFFPNTSKDPRSLNCSNGYPVVRFIHKLPSTLDSIRYALDELLDGPNEEEKVRGYVSPIPRSNQITRYMKLAGEKLGWRMEDTCVAITRIAVHRDTAFVEFSTSMRTYGGGSCLAAAISGPIRQTILQFPVVKHVRFLIEGVQGEDVFQP